MNRREYLASITDEIRAVQNRVRSFIESHWLSDGMWKESILRAILRRHLPKTIGIGNGFIFTDKKTSTQIDILLYDNTRPVLFQDGDFVIVTPDCVRGIIEVKTRVEKNQLNEIFSKLADNIQVIPFGHTEKRFFGVFCYEADFQNITDREVAAEILDKLFAATRGISKRVANCVSIDSSFFIRYWVTEPNSQNVVDRWHAYNMKDIAPAYFIHNVIEHLCPESVRAYDTAWFMEEGKERSKIAERASGVLKD